MPTTHRSAAPATTPDRQRRQCGGQRRAGDDTIVGGHGAGDDVYDGGTGLIPLPTRRPSIRSASTSTRWTAPRTRRWWYHHWRAIAGRGFRGDNAGGYAQGAVSEPTRSWASKRRRRAGRRPHHRQRARQRERAGPEMTVSTAAMAAALGLFRQSRRLHDCAKPRWIVDRHRHAPDSGGRRRYLA